MAVSFAVYAQALHFPKRPSMPVAVIVAALGLAVWAVMRLGILVSDRPLPLSFALCLLTFVWIRRKGLLWITSAGFVVVAAYERYFVFTSNPFDSRTLDLILLTISIAAFSAVMHLLIVAVETIESRSKLLSRSNAELSAVWRTAPAGLCITNADLSDIRVNAYASWLLGCVHDENIASEFKSGRISALHDGVVMPLEKLPFFRAARENIFIEPAEWDLVGPNGRRITVLLAAAPVREVEVRDGILRTTPTGGMKASGAVAAFNDISSAKRLQRELDLRRREAEEASVRKTRFLSSVSHDIRTPANAISLLAELLGHAASNPSMTAEIPKFASDLRASSQKLVDLVSDVLDFTKLDSSRVELVETAFDLEELINEEVQQASILASNKGIRVVSQPISQRVSLRTDRVKLGRILGNLLSNGVKFTSAGAVTVSADRNRAGDVVLKVMDTGPGIPSEALGRIFDEFYQVRSNTASADPSRHGSGLGLAICRRLAAAMGMRLEVESKVSEGTTFILTIPEPLTVLSSRETST